MGVADMARTCGAIWKSPSEDVSVLDADILELRGLWYSCRD